MQTLWEDKMPVSLTSYVASLMKVILCSSFVRSRVADAEVSKLCSRQQAMCSSEGIQVFKTSSQPAHTTFPIATMQLSFFFLNLFIYFNWRTITSQHCDGPCHRSTWISHRGTCTPLLSWTPLPPPSPLHPSGWSQSTSFECPPSSISTGHLFYIW